MNAKLPVLFWRWRSGIKCWRYVRLKIVALRCNLGVNTSPWLDIFIEYILNQMKMYYDRNMPGLAAYKSHGIRDPQQDLIYEPLAVCV